MERSLVVSSRHYCEQFGRHRAVHRGTAGCESLFVVTGSAARRCARTVETRIGLRMRPQSPISQLSPALADRFPLREEYQQPPVLTGCGAESQSTFELGGSQRD